MPVKDPYAEFQQPAKTNGDPYAEFQKPVADDPYAAIASPSSPSPSPGKGFFGSFADQSGLSSLPSAIMHPIDTLMGVGPNLVKMANDSGDAFHQGVQSLKQNGLTTETRRDFGRSVPIVGPLLAAAQEQHDAGNNSGMAGTLAGGVAGFAAPEAAGKVLKIAGKAGGTALKVASASTPSLKLAATRILASGTPGELLQSALKPGVKYGVGAGETLARALPDVLAADPNLQGVSGFAKAADVAREQAFEPYNNLVAPYRQPMGVSEMSARLPAPNAVPVEGAAGPFRPSAISGNPIADAQMQSIPAMNRFEDVPTVSSSPMVSAPPPNAGVKVYKGSAEGYVSKAPAPAVRFPSPPKGGIVNNTAAVADLYRQDLAVPHLDDIRTDANAKLNAFYNKAGGDQAAALSNPETARVKAVGDSTRGVLYPQLEKDAGLPAGTVDAMQAKYGTLVDASDIASKREPVFARHDPVTLSQKIVSGHGNPLSMAWNYGVQKVLGDLVNSDALVNSAVDKYRNPSGPKLIPRAGIVPQSAARLGNYIQGLPGIPRYVSPFLLKKPDDQ